jgi:nitroreductase
MLVPMDFQDVVRRRRMVRSYTPEPVDPAILDRALANATRAPSAGFSQGWGFLVLDTEEDVRRYWAVTADAVDDPDEWLRGMMSAPVVVVPCSSKAAYLERYAEPDIGHRAPDLPPQSAGLTERRRGVDDVVHRGHWGRR